MTDSRDRVEVNEAWEPSEEALMAGLQAAWPSKNGYYKPYTVEVRRAIQAAYNHDHPAPRCDKRLVHGATGSPVTLSTGRRFRASWTTLNGDGKYGEVAPVECKLPANHEGDHVPDVPEACWQ